MRFIGIDPGKTGAIAVINEFAEIIDVKKMPATPGDILRFLVEQEEAAIKASVTPSDTIRAALEYVRASPLMGVVSVSTFMRNYGHLEMALTAAGIPYYDVHPARWQRYLGCLSSGDKNITKAKAAELWPATKITHAIADALLIAEWCRRKHVGLIVEQSVGTERVNE